MWNGVDPHEFVFHRNYSLSLVISEIQIDLGVYWFTLVPIMDSLYSDSGVRTLDWLLMQWSYVFLALTHWIYVCHYLTDIQGSYWAGLQKSILLTLGLLVNIPTNWVNTMFFDAMAPWITRLSTDLILIIKISMIFSSVRDFSNVQCFNVEERYLIEIMFLCLVYTSEDIKGSFSYQ